MGSRKTITWHIDDLKISHVDADEVTNVLDWMKGIYGSNIKKSCREKNVYLGIDLDFIVDREVRVKMTDYLNIIASEFTDTIQGRVVTPLAEHLFNVR